MGTMLFCTTQVPTKIIDELLHCAAEDEINGNHFSLVRQPSQEEFDFPTQAPVGDFENGFNGWTIDALGIFFRERNKANLEGKNAVHWALETFAVLDERSVLDKTLLVIHWWASSPPEYDEDPEEQIKHFTWSWWTRRVKFQVAGHFAAAVRVNGGFMLEELAEDEQGVVQVPV